MMNLDRILSDLKAERERITRAIDALIGSAGQGGSRRGPKPGTRRRKRRLSAEGRRRISEAMKKRWAERKRRAA